MNAYVPMFDCAAGHLVTDKNHVASAVEVRALQLADALTWVRAAEGALRRGPLSLCAVQDTHQHRGEPNCGRWHRDCVNENDGRSWAEQKGSNHQVATMPSPVVEPGTSGDTRHWMVCQAGHTACSVQSTSAPHDMTTRSGIMLTLDMMWVGSSQSATRHDV